VEHSKKGRRDRTKRVAKKVKGKAPGEAKGTTNRERPVYPGGEKTCAHVEVITVACKVIKRPSDQTSGQLERPARDITSTDRPLVKRLH